MKTRHQPMLPKPVRVVIGCFLGVILFVTLLVLLQAGGAAGTPAAAAPNSFARTSPEPVRQGSPLTGSGPGSAMDRPDAAGVSANPLPESVDSTPAGWSQARVKAPLRSSRGMFIENAGQLATARYESPLTRSGPAMDRPAAEGTMPSRLLEAQSENVELVGQIGGATYAVAVQGNYAYVGVGPRLVVLDVSDPANPRMVGQTAVLPGLVRGVYVAGGYAYVAAGDAGLRVVDVSDPAAPREVGFYDTAGFANDVYVAGGYAYVADAPQWDGSQWVGGGLRVVDVSNPAVPWEVGFYSTAGGAEGVYVAGGYAYVADGGAGLRVVDVSDPAAPREVGSYDTPGDAEGVYVAGEYAYVAAGWYGGLRVVDVSNPVAPQEVGFYDTPGHAYDVYVAGGYAYVADYWDGLRVVDVSNPAAPQGAGFYDTPGHAYDVYVAGGYAYVADGGAGLRVVDVSDPAAPREVGSYDTPGDAEGVYVAGEYAYVAAGWYGGLRVVDVSNPVAPQEVGFYDTPEWDARSVAVAGNYAYVADARLWEEGAGGLWVIDISDPATPVRVGFYDLREGDILGGATDVHVAGTYAYVADWWGGLRIVDVSDPAAPVAVGTYETWDFSVGVYVASDYAYLANWDDSWGSGGFLIVDISHPTAPAGLGSIRGRPAYDVYVAGGYAYLAEGTGGYGGLRVIDVSDPATPVMVGFYATPGEAYGVYVAGSYAYVAAGEAGLRVVDVSNPADPREVGFYDTPGWADGVYVAGNYAYVADQSGGLFILRFTGAEAEPDNFADLGNPEDEAQHNLIGWGAAQGPPENPFVSPSGDTTKRYQALRADNSLDLMVDQVNVPYLLTTEVEDGICTDNFEIYINGQGPLYQYTGRNAGTENVTVEVHRVVVSTAYVTQPRVTVTFRNTSTDDCGLAAVYNVGLERAFQISGRVTDDVGNPIAGATVSASGPASASTTTGDDGTYALPNLPAGTYSVSVSKAGYVSPPAQDVPVPPDVSGVDFVLTVETYSISGRLTDDAGNPIPGATVSASGPASASTTTGSDGTYTLPNLPAGTYIVQPSKRYWTFSPISRTVPLPPSATGQDFRGTMDPDFALALKYAPVLRLHSEDPYNPNPISVMLDNAWLRSSWIDYITSPPIHPDDLVRYSSESYEIDLWYASYDKAKEHENWYKNFGKDKIETYRAYARVWRHPNETHTVIQYWLFYYYNDFHNKHEGDWEMEQVVLEGTGTNPIPIYAAYAQHNTGSKRRWSRRRPWEGVVEKEDGTHPVVYVAKGSHASYFKKGRHSIRIRGIPVLPIRDITVPGRRISVAREDRVELLRSDSDPPWLQFAGRWGERSPWCDELLDECGPSGPSHQGIKWTNPFGFGAANAATLSDAQQASSWFDSLPWDELAPHYNTSTRVILANCQSHVLSLTDTQGRRLGPDVNEIDPTGRSAEYIRNCDPGGAGRQTILIHDPDVVVSRIDLLPDVTAARTAGEVRIQQTQVVTLEVNLPDYANNRVTHATYTTVTVGITTTGSISVTAGGDLVLEVDNDGDGTTDETVNPTLEETEQDFTAPTVVSDLAVTEVITGAVTLSWTAPGDDGVTGTAASYDIRYYTAPITATNWVSATQVVSRTVPVAAGTTQTMTVSDLPSGTLYFAVRAIDEVGNTGDISNTPGATVIGYPEGDFDHSCLVDAEDVQDVAGRWRTRIGDAGYDLAFDLNQDAYINIVDIMRVAARWGDTCSTPPGLDRAHTKLGGASAD